MSINPAATFDGYPTNTSINTSTEAVGSVIYELSQALPSATDYVVNVAGG